MIKKALQIATLLLAVLITSGFILYMRNTAPVVPPVSAVEAANTVKPYVVKLHAQWCAVCMVTKGVWSEIEKTYAGRVNLLVLDFTTEAKAEASRAEATRLGLTKFFEEYGGATGNIVVLDGRTKDVTASINGSRDFATYRAAIDAALARYSTGNK
jgi:thiol-disulfide isomerase/thioredoxin